MAGHPQWPRTWRNYLLRRQQTKLIEDQQRILEEKNKHLQYLATHDPLTGLLNRSHFKEIVDLEMNRMQHTKKEACIVLVDIDFFKRINDQFGHPAGDRILQETSKLITSNLGNSAVSARLGGEEFIILIQETNVQDGGELAEKLRSKIESYFFEADGKLLRITASFGVAPLMGTLHSSYNEADKALYIAKNNGRNCVEIVGDFVIA